MNLNPCRKGVVALAFCILSAFVLTGCRGPQEVSVIDGYVVTDGVFLAAQLDAYTTVYNEYFGEEEFLDGANEEGVSNLDRIAEETMNILYKVAYANRNFDTADKTLTEEQQQELDFNLTYSYDQSGQYLADNGIGEQSYTELSTMLYKFDLLFSEMYDIDGEREPSDDEVAQYFADTYAPIISINIPLVDSSYAPLTEELLDEQGAIAEDMIAALSDGDDMEEVIKEYLPDALINAANEPFDAENITQYYNEELVSEESYSFTDEQIAQIQAESAGAVGMVEDTTSITVYIVEEDDNELIENDYRSSLIYEMFYDEFEAEVYAEAAGYTYEADDFAMNYYSPKNII